jgi:predicted RNA-binding protein YlxR (DUF448 family)
VLIRDDAGNAGGRGIYTCASRACFEAARERRGFARGARANVMVDAGLADALGDEEAVGGA